jgi:hypothetical protein
MWRRTVDQSVCEWAVRCLLIGVTLTMILWLAPQHASGASPLVWGSAQVTDPGDLGGESSAVSCSSASFCLAVTAGQIATSTDPLASDPLWRHVTPATVAGESEVAGASCPSASLCVIVSGLDVEVSTDPAAGTNTWEAFPVADSAISGISCPTSRLCVAIDSAGQALISTDPAGGSAAWQAFALPTSSAPYECGKYGPGDDCTATLDSVACASVLLCVVGDEADESAGDVISSTTPTVSDSWRSDQLSDQDGVASISCPSSSSCYALSGDDKGRPALFHSENPAAGVTSWQPEYLKTLPQSVSCGTPHLCAGFFQTTTDAPFSALASSSPLLPTSWSAAVLSRPSTTAIGSVGPVFFQLTQTTCAAAGFCVIDSSPGDVYIGASPAVVATDLRSTIKAAFTKVQLSRSGTTVAVPINLQFAGTISLSARLGSGREPVVLGAATVPTAQTTKLRLHVTKVGRERLAHDQRARMTAELTLTPKSGPRVTTSVTLTTRLSGSA